MKLLTRIEQLGNRLPDPATLFVIGTIVVMGLSQLAVALDWSAANPATGTVRAQSLLTAEGLWWLISHLVENFIRFPPLAIVLVGMLGIGLAELSGLLPVLLRFLIVRVPAPLLTPATVFLGIMSSLALDAGYVVLPPIAAALYLAAGRSPLTGIAAVFAGVSAGFSANLLITAVDPLLAGLTQAGAQIIDPGYRVAVTANWWFMIISTVLLTLTGWAVTAWFVEPRLNNTNVDNNSEPALQAEQPNSMEIAGLRNASLITVFLLIILILCTTLPGAPLHGEGVRFPRWVEATVPLLFLLFFLPGVVYGMTARTIRTDRDVARMLGETMARLGPYIVLAFFAAQFIETFNYSGLGKLLAIAGGQFLSDLQLPSSSLLGCFVMMVVTANLFIGSASAKYAFFAPVFVPMLMQVGISPELTQAAYRVGDSVSNVITPLNPYMIIILVLVQKYARGSGLGTLIAIMLPYALVFLAVWTILLLSWVVLDIPLGPGGGLHYAAGFTLR
jgi:aminobenzoyl-glutamate transport protein